MAGFRHMHRHPSVHGTSQRQSDGRLGSSGRSLAMHKVPSLFFDLEMSEPQQNCTDVSEDRTTQLRVQDAIKPRSDFASQVQVAADQAVQQISRQFAFLADVEIALTQGGYLVQQQNSHTGASAANCLQHLKHTFLVCTEPGTEGTKVIVDPVFRDQFQVAKPTRRYTDVLDIVPQTFVGTYDQIAEVVRLVSTELLRCFAKNNAHVPPWRRTASMLSKWTPLNNPAPRPTARASEPISRHPFHQQAQPAPKSPPLRNLDPATLSAASLPVVHRVPVHVPTSKRKMCPPLPTVTVAPMHTSFHPPGQTRQLPIVKSMPWYVETGDSAQHPMVKAFRDQESLSVAAEDSSKILARQLSRHSLSGDISDSAQLEVVVRRGFDCPDRDV